MEIFRATFLADPADFKPKIVEACASGEVRKCPKTGFEIWFEYAPIDREESSDWLNIDVRLAPEDIVALRFDGEPDEFDTAIDDDYGYDDYYYDGNDAFLWQIITPHGDYHVTRCVFENLATALIEAGHGDKVEPFYLNEECGWYELIGGKWKKFEYGYED